MDVRENGDGMGTGGGIRKVLKWWEAREMGELRNISQSKKG